MDWTVMVLILQCLVLDSVTTTPTTEQPHRGIISYKVSVFTGTVPNGDTNARVYITMFGELGESPKHQIDDPNDNFEEGREDIFYLISKDLGTLERIRIQHGNNGDDPSWFLDKVIVEDMDNRQSYTFVCDQWLARDKADGATSRDLYVSCLKTYQGLTYRGQLSVTRDNLTCQAWSANTPHHNNYTDPSLYPDTSLSEASNFCRNPNSHPEGPWCYTTNPDVEFSFCDIPLCNQPAANLPRDFQPPKECLTSPQGWEYRGNVSVTESGRTCQAWRAQVPHSHGDHDPGFFKDSTLRDVANYCRMPAGSNVATRPWCYTTDPAVRWEHCDIPMCLNPNASANSQLQDIGVIGHLIVSLVLVHLVR